MAIERIGVIGAGQMGNGIAHVLALAGYDVVLDDINKDTLAKALERIDKNMHRQAARGLIKDDLITPALKRIRVTQALDDMRDRDLVIEAATEDEATKKKIFQELCPRLGAQYAWWRRTRPPSRSRVWLRRQTGRNISSASIS